jgi:enoyl-CoA hydratase/carnithine racemase
MDDDLVKFQQTGRIAILTLNRAPVNALNRAMWLALDEAVQRLSDPSIHVAILTAEGKRVFCAGADLNELIKDTDEDRQARHRIVTPIQDRLHHVSIPMICAINGPSVGAGLALMGHCDYRISADHAHFSMTEVDRGTAAGGGSSLSRLGVPSGMVREMLYTGRRVSAYEALAAQLVDKVVPYEHLTAATMALADQIASKPRSALEILKRAILLADSEPDWLRAYTSTHALTDEVAVLAETREGLSAFLEKREPGYARD